MFTTDQYHGILAETVTVNGANGDHIHAYLARPLGPGPFPSVVLIHNVLGWGEYYHEMTRKFAHHGYVAICPNLFDRDGDGVADDRDACPTDAGRPSDDPKRSGCPELVRVGAGAIDIFQQVTFEEGKDVLRAESLELLRQIGRLLADHPEIARVAVDGHTDDVGAAKDNLELSRKRAVAVSRWLTEQALVDARRLEARGFGARQPLVKNDTPENRAKNRRVEFQIRRRTDEGAAGWTDGPID